MSSDPTSPMKQIEPYFPLITETQGFSRCILLSKDLLIKKHKAKRPTVTETAVTIESGDTLPPNEILGQ